MRKNRLITAERRDLSQAQQLPLVRILHIEIARIVQMTMPGGMERMEIYSVIGRISTRM